jgi:hypothetical protein
MTMERTASRLSRWIYYLAAAFIYSAAVLRAMMVYSASTYLGIILADKEK